MPHIFLDCDGVLADFDGYFKGVFGADPTETEERHGSKRLWMDLGAHEDLYYKLPLMPDAMRLYKAVRHLKPTILTGRPASGLWAVDQKLRWTRKHFQGVPTIVCLSKDKQHHMTAPGDILVDDRLKYAPFWKDAGGVFVLHQNAERTIRDLKGMGTL